MRVRYRSDHAVSEAVLKTLSAALIDGSRPGTRRRSQAEHNAMPRSGKRQCRLSLRESANQGFSTATPTTLTCRSFCPLALQTIANQLNHQREQAQQCKRNRQ